MASVARSTRRNPLQSLQEPAAHVAGTDGAGRTGQLQGRLTANRKVARRPIARHQSDRAQQAPSPTVEDSASARVTRQQWNYPPSWTRSNPSAAPQAARTASSRWSAISAPPVDDGTGRWTPPVRADRLHLRTQR